MSQSKKLEGVGVLKSTLMSDIEMQNLEFALVVFLLVLVQYFIIIIQFLPFGTEMYIMCLCVLEVGYLCCDFYLMGRGV